MDQEKFEYQKVLILTNELIDICHQYKIPIILAYQERDYINENHVFIKDKTNSRLYSALNVLKTGDPRWGGYDTITVKQHENILNDFKSLLLKMRSLIKNKQYDKMNIIYAEIDNLLSRFNN